MFLDPDPKQKRHSMTPGSGFFSSQRPIESPRDHRKATRRKTLQPLHERSASELNQQNPWLSPDKSTVRLVKPSPPSPAGEWDERGELAAKDGGKENNEGELVSPRANVVKPASVSQPEIPGFDASSQDKSVSDSNASANEAHADSRTDDTSLLSTTPTHADGFPRKEWHRRSGSTGNYSTASTLKEAESAFEKKNEGRFSEASQVTTLRGTPTPSEREIRERIEAEDPTARQVSSQTLATLQEDSPDRSTVRVVPPAESSSNSSEPAARSEPSDSEESSIVRTFPSPSPSPEVRSSGSPRIPQRTSSIGALPAPLTVRKTSASPTTPRQQPSRASVAQSEASLSPTSSPNFVSYGPDSSPARTGAQPIPHSRSVESIQTRLQYPTVVRPETGRSFANSNSSASVQPNSSTDTLPRLQIPKKRLRHKQAISSLNAAASSAMDDEIDTEPYPRDPFSSHLSTIASESERTNSRQLSHFSLGSGVLTGDDASSILPLSSTGTGRRASAPIDSVAYSENSPLAPEGSSEEEAGDMTLGVFREESAKPQPLFQPRSGSAPGKDRKYDGPLPPIPPIPQSRDGDETDDQVSELHTPQLREKRSGYSLRRRSNSTPSHTHSRHLSQISRSDSIRWSQASSLFPTWAKNFYGNGAQLMSASKISLGLPPPTPRRENGHARNNSQWTERSITSRLGTGYAEMESPSGSHFHLPSIFRPRTRGREGKESKKRKSKRSRPSKDEPRADSMTIEPFPAMPQGGGGVTDATLPSGHPRYGSLKDSSEQPRPLPRKYSKQRRWNEMEFPRPMTKDRLSDFGMHMDDPHLAPSKRSTYRLSTWRAPSFVESLDTLVRSKCNRQILLFAFGFVCPILWMIGAVLPIPRKPISADDFEASLGGSEDDIQAAMMKHEAGDAEKRWREEKVFMKAQWWRYLNRIMSVIGVLVIAAVIALAVVATR